MATKTWQQKRMYFIHEQNSGLSLVKGNINLARKYIKLFNDSKLTINEFIKEIEDCLERAESGTKKIKDSEDYIYEQIKHLS